MFFSVLYSYSFYRGDRRFGKFALAASTAGFTFRDHGISDDRIAECENCEEEFAHRKTPGKGWELLYEEKDMLAFRRRIDGPYEIYEYKCVGTYYDISPRTFLDAQNDLKYRKEWDDNIVTIEVVKEENENELIRWVSKFPYPMYPREYVYVRRTWVSEDEKYAVLDSESVQPEVSICNLRKILNKIVKIGVSINFGVKCPSTILHFENVNSSSFKLGIAWS